MSEYINHITSPIYFIFIFVMNLDNVKIVNHVGFNEEMQNEAICVAQKALKLFDNEKEMGRYIKHELDIKFDGKWCVVVGRCCFQQHTDMYPVLCFWIDKCFFYIFSSKSEWMKILNNH